MPLVIKIGITVGAGMQSQGSQFDADYQAVLTYATTQGYTLPSASQQALQNQLVLDLKAGGVWNKLDTFAVFATDGNTDFALIDWIRLTQYTAVNSPTFNTNEGFKGNGTSSYIDSNYAPSTMGVNYTLNNAGYGYYMRQYDTAPGIREGAWNASGGSQAISWIRYPVKRVYLNSPISVYINFTAQSNQFAAANRTNSTTVNLYSNGILQDTILINSFLLSNGTFRVFQVGSDYSDSQISMVYAGADLTTEQNNFYNAINTYLTSL
jgi:hypothetical protein